MVRSEQKVGEGEGDEDGGGGGRRLRFSGGTIVNCVIRVTIGSQEDFYLVRFLCRYKE